jgi:PAS domain-containing protein
VAPIEAGRAGAKDLPSARKSGRDLRVRRTVISTVENIGEHALATLLENTDDAVVVTDASGAIRYWNSAAEAMFGHSPEEAIGASLDIIIPEKLRERHWAGYRRVMATGETQYVGLNTSRAAAFTARRGRA